MEYVVQRSIQMLEELYTLIRQNLIAALSLTFAMYKICASGLKMLSERLSPEKALKKLERQLTELELRVQKKQNVKKSK